MEKEAIFELVVTHTCEVIPALKTHSFKPEETLKELGANSLDRTDILDDLMESLGLDVPRVELFGTKNIGELVDLLYEHSLKK
ncbi:MAG TPA: poly(3-hydroxyalkanoate) depolymerase [Desulfobacteraceae bacterium]|nr:poly(3-hydroxyalkanoate) depolymerase [Desulfobacteraceae bacterium]|tara:strand:- start:765 stop:1013 length:249 start_codon:yes stop_codon:yes gene_type:complete